MGIFLHVMCLISLICYSQNYQQPHKLAIKLQMCVLQVRLQRCVEAMGEDTGILTTQRQHHVGWVVMEYLHLSG